MCAIEFDDSIGEEVLIKLHKDLYQKGFIIGLKPAFKVLRFYPPLIIEKEVIDLLLKAMNEVFEKL